MRKRLLLFVGIGVLAAAAIYALRQAQSRRPLVAQPFLPFSHKTHIAAGFKCAACHVYADTQAFAGIPAVQECLECHASWGAKTPGLADLEPSLKQMAERDKEIPWKKVYRVPGHTYFSHQRHVSLAQLDCAVCHGDMTKVTSPVVRQAIPITMERCMECHRQQKVTTDCLACHR